MVRFIGMDVHREFAQLAVVEDGVVRDASLLGADDFKPPGQARSDSVWCFGDAMWATIEAKSDQKPDGPVAVRDVREANTQLRLLASDRAHAVPAGDGAVPRSSKPGQRSFVRLVRKCRRRRTALTGLRHHEACTRDPHRSWSRE
jgi:hypothetical protein